MGNQPSPPSGLQAEVQPSLWSQPRCTPNTNRRHWGLIQFLFRQHGVFHKCAINDFLTNADHSGRSTAARVCEQDRCAGRARAITRWPLAVITGLTRMRHFCIKRAWCTVMDTHSKPSIHPIPQQYFKFSIFKTCRLVRTMLMFCQSREILSYWVIIRKDRSCLDANMRRSSMWRIGQWTVPILIPVQLYSSALPWCHVLCVKSFSTLEPHFAYRF